MQPTPASPRFTRPALVAAVLAFCLATTAAAGLAGSAVAGSAFDTRSPMSLVFTAGSAHLVGSQALVPVRCEGPRGGICNGTAVLKVAGRTHTVPFAVTGGTRSSLAVTLGSADSLRGKRAVALARTLQSGGGHLRAREVLRLE